MDKINAEIQEVLNQARAAATGVYEILFYSYKSYLDFVSQSDLTAGFISCALVVR